MRSILVVLILGLVLGGCAREFRPATPRPGPDLAAQRALQIRRLHAYRVAGVFPVDDRGYPLSVFRDRRGKPCPMAALIEQSGQRALVDRVVRDNNRLRLADVHDGPLMDWMSSSGLTQEEVAYVQGILRVDNSFVLPETADPVMTAHQQVVRRLEEAERVLLADTVPSLEVAYARLPGAGGARVATTH
jgi:hypothetical protein